MSENTQCAVGRSMTVLGRPMGTDLDWSSRCPERAVETLTVPCRRRGRLSGEDLPFCEAHGRNLLEVMFTVFDAAGLIDHDIVAGP